MKEFKNDFSQEVWGVTYQDSSDVDVTSNWRRISKDLASVEEEDKRDQIEQRFYNLVENFKFVPAGRIYANAGTQWGGTTYINCFVSDRNKHDIDSIEGIYSVLKDQALTLKSEGGWGCNFSFIRPRGSFIHGIGVESPGPIAFMNLFNQSSTVITAGSGEKLKNKQGKKKIRKGAMMGILDVWHPSIKEFVKAKQTSNVLDKFNISVGMYNEFMDKIEKIETLKSQGKDIPEELDKWELRFPDTTFPKYKDDWKGDIYDWVDRGHPVVVYDTVSAYELWELIMKSTYKRNDPGVLFLDIANKTHCWNYGDKKISRILSTNPCVSGDTNVKTNKGQIKIKELTDRFNSGETFEVYSYSDSGKLELRNLEDSFKTRKNANLIRLELDDGDIVKLTPEHKVFTENRGYIKASQLTDSDILLKLV